jgi:hypothetical protein
MKRLGEILLERGAIAVSELHSGLEACHHKGGRLGTQLLKFGFVDEHALLDALSEQLDVPSVAASVLRRAPAEVRRLLPMHVSRRLQALVFKRSGGRACVAMTNPKNPAVMEEIISYVGAEVEPFVATEAGILTALAEFAREPEEDGGLPPHTSIPVGGSGWDRLWASPPLRPSDLFRAEGLGRRGTAPLAAAFPSLAPVPETGTVAASGGLDDASYTALLHAAAARDEIGELLLRRATSVLDRCSLFAVHSGKVVGWMARGAVVVVDDVQSFAVSLELPSIFSDLAGADGFCGKVPPGPVNDVLKQVLGEPVPRELAVFPIRVKNRVVAYLLGDVPGGKLPDGVQRQLLPAVMKAGVALEILILKKKILG